MKVKGYFQQFHLLRVYFQIATILVTGSQGGIAKSICELLIKSGSYLIKHSRSKLLITGILCSPTVFIDFSSVVDTTKVLTEMKLQRLDHVLHVAGLLKRNEKTSVMHCVNCLSPFALTLLLIPNILSSKVPRITFITSSSHIRSPSYSSGDFQKYLFTSSAGKYHFSIF